MNGTRTLGITLTALMLTLAGCVTTRSSLTSSAERLDHSTDNFARTWNGYSRDVEMMADDAHAFRRTSEDRDATDADVRAAFERVSHSYLLVRDEVDRSDNTTAREDLRPVTSAYLDVERDMGGHSARSFEPPAG